jgi:Ca2+-binding RTX toxin-like protein
MVGGTYDMETIDLSGVASDVTIEIAGGAQALTTGTGDDEVNVGGSLARTDTIDLGEGENTLFINDASAATVASYTVPAQIAQMVAAISNVDILQVSDQLANDIDVDRFGGVQNVVLAAGATIAEISSLATSGSVVTLESNATDLTLSIDNATLAGRNSDELTLALDGAGITVGTLTLPGVDTLNISSEGGANEITNLTATSLDTLVVTGDSDLLINTVLVNTIQTVDASAMTTGAINVEVATGGTTGVTMTGGASADVLIGGDGNDIINGGAGADAITGGAGNDVIIGGLGSDGISGGAGADMIDLTEAVASADLVVYFAVTEGSAAGVAGGRLTGFDQITKFGSTDDIDVTALYSGADGGLTIVAQNAAVNNANDLTDAEFNVVNDLVAFFNDGGSDLAGVGAETDVVAINFGDFAAIYAISDAAGVGNGLVEAGEITLLGTVDDILVAADFVV